MMQGELYYLVKDDVGCLIGANFYMLAAFQGIPVGRFDGFEEPWI